MRSGTSTSCPNSELDKDRAWGNYSHFYFMEFDAVLGLIPRGHTPNPFVRDLRRTHMHRPSRTYKLAVA